MRDYMLRRYHARRAESYAILGGKCVVCGTSDDLQIDWSVSRERYLKSVRS